MGDTFSVVLPYYNEADYLPRTLNCWLHQTRRPDQLILVNNASTDASEDQCRRLIENVEDIDVVMLREPRPGKIYALETGCARVTGTFVVLADADTYYPPDYLSRCAGLAAEASDDIVSIMALPVGDRPHSLVSRLRRHGGVLLSRVVDKALVGGHGQVLRTSALKAVGGFSVDYWKYVLLDHEILNRLFHLGRSRYHAGLWCQPSARRADRRRVRWTVAERMLYFLTPAPFQDWYFYSFLGPRLDRRHMSQLRLREKPWAQARRQLQESLEVRSNPTLAVGVDSG